MVTRGVSQPPFSFIFAEAPLILCKEDLEIYIHSLFNGKKCHLGSRRDSPNGIPQVSESISGVISPTNWIWPAFCGQWLDRWGKGKQCFRPWMAHVFTDIFRQTQNLYYGCDWNMFIFRWFYHVNYNWKIESASSGSDSFGCSFSADTPSPLTARQTGGHFFSP